jgi:nucleoside-diphosphate-sugar epimerase
MSKILIIGGNGYIGSRLHEKLPEATSWDLCLFPQNLGKSILKNFGKHLEELEAFDDIILLAAHGGVGIAEYNHNRAWLNNVDYFYQLCEKLNKDQRLIYASTGSVYGTNEGISTEKDMIIDPVNHYDLTKIIGDVTANNYIKQGKKLYGLRFGTVNGVSANTRSDVMINAMFLNNIQNGSIKVQKPRTRRPLLGIEDLTNGIIRILEKTNAEPGQYNMCSFNTTVGEVANKLKSLLNTEVTITDDHGSGYNFEIDNFKFENEFDFKFTDSVESIIEGFQSRETFFSRRDTDGDFAKWM